MAHFVTNNPNLAQSSKTTTQEKNEKTAVTDIISKFNRAWMNEDHNTPFKENFISRIIEVTPLDTYSSSPENQVVFCKKVQK